MFGLNSSLPPLVGGGGGDSVGKADLISDHVDGTQSRMSVDPSPSLITFAFRSRDPKASLW